MAAMPCIAPKDSAIVLSVVECHLTTSWTSLLSRKAPTNTEITSEWRAASKPMDSKALAAYRLVYWLEKDLTCDTSLGMTTETPWSTFAMARQQPRKCGSASY